MWPSEVEGMGVKDFGSPAVDLLKAPEAGLNQQLGSLSRQKGASSEGQSTSKALGLPTDSASAPILTPATTLLAILLNPEM